MEKPKEIIKQMNDLGKQGKSFIFLIDFEMKSPLIFRLENTEEDILFKIPGYSNHSEKTEKKT